VQILATEIRKSRAVRSLGNMTDAPKSSHCTWEGAFWPPTTNVQVCCLVEETNCLMPINMCHL
jgi:hypothetical protein